MTEYQYRIFPGQSRTNQEQWTFQIRSKESGKIVKQGTEGSMRLARERCFQELRRLKQEEPETTVGWTDAP